MSGQYLSPSDAGRALTPATHLRLGRPLPHQLANRTQTAPRAINLWSGDIIWYYRQFPDAIPDPRARDLRVTIPFAAFILIAEESRSTCMPNPRRQRSF